LRFFFFFGFFFCVLLAWLPWFFGYGLCFFLVWKHSLVFFFFPSVSIPHTSRRRLFFCFFFVAKPSPPKPTPRKSNLPPAQQGKQLLPSLPRANFDEGRVVTTVEKTRCKPSLIAPEYFCDEDIPINDTDTLAEVCFELHEKVKTLGSASPLGVSARMELKFVSPSSLRAKMLIDPVVWYDQVLNDYPDRVKVARQYVTEARRMQTKVHSYIDPTTHPTSVVPAQYCQYGVSCTHFSDPHRCKNKHSNRALQWC
jgi:hypothetical protein